MANGNSKMYSSGVIKSLVQQAGLKIINQSDEIGMAHTLLECGM
jgi:hypothetical protein